jgi:hypothetical protein
MYKIYSELNISWYYIVNSSTHLQRVQVERNYFSAALNCLLLGGKPFIFSAKLLCSSILACRLFVLGNYRKISKCTRAVAKFCPHRIELQQLREAFFCAVRAEML